MADLPDYYAILGVSPLAEDIVIRAAYRALAQRYHPDRYSGPAAEATRRMADLNAAYEVLSDPTRRKAYDQQRGSGAADAGSYFDDAEQDPAPSFDPLTSDWDVAVTYHPSLKEIVARLGRFSWRLAYAYQAAILESKDFKNARGIADKMEDEFISSYFGSDAEVMAFARGLVLDGHRKAALALNRAVKVLGASTNPKAIIEKVRQGYCPPGYETKAEKDDRADQERMRAFQEQDRAREIRYVIWVALAFAAIFLLLHIIDKWRSNAVQSLSSVVEPSAPVARAGVFPLADEDLFNELSDIHSRDNGASFSYLMRAAQTSRLRIDDNVQLIESSQSAENKVPPEQDAMVLEANEHWWYIGVRQELILAILNLTTGGISSVRFEIANGGCADRSPGVSRMNYSLVFGQPIAPARVGVFRAQIPDKMASLLNTGSKPGWGCLAIVESWRAR